MKIVIVHDVYDNTKNEEHESDNVCQFLVEYFGNKRPENLRIYHNSVSEQTDITPKSESDIKRLQELDGVLYVVIYPAIAPLLIAKIVFWVVTAVMAAYSVYTILTMPKPNANSSIGSSNNELANRSNQARVKSRIPDIYGTVRAYPDLIGVVYTYYQNGIEIEECLMAIGRGYYQIHDCRDGDTAVEGIDGVDVSIYDPGANIRGTTTIYKAGETFTSLPLAIRKSGSINGQSLVKPNDVSLISSQLYFLNTGIIKTNDTSMDFTQLFKAGDGLVINGANFGVLDANLSGNAVVTSSSTIVVQTELDIADFSQYKGVLLNGATFEYVLETTIVDPENPESNTVVTERSFRDLSGQYDVSSITRVLIGTLYTYTITLSSPRQVNYNWNFVVENHTISAGITLNKSENSINLDDAYSVSGVSATQITLSNAATVNSDWTKILTLFGGSTQGHLANVDLEIVANKWVGWFSVFFPNATHLSFNVYFPNGMYSTTDSGKERPAYCIIEIQYQMIDDAGNSVGGVLVKSYKVETQTKDSFGRTFKFALPETGNVRFRLAKTYAKENNRPITEAKIKDVYASYALNKSSYAGVTVVRTKTVATDGALSVKERKLNCLVTRKLPVDGIGALVATRDAGQALINLALDQYIGRRSTTEIDIAQIKSEMQSVKTYFGTDQAAEFSYTFDDDKLSFEEQAGMIASAVFCEAYRFGNKLRVKFEKPQDNSVLLFNHRNKVPGSEKRTYNFGIDKDYDGVELEYTNPDGDTRSTYLIPEDGSAINALKITTTGIRNHAVAKTRAWREWNKLQYQSAAVEFDALDESNLLTRNDRILVADNTVTDTQDGEVEAVNVLTLTLSQDVIFEDGATYYCNLQMPDGTVDIILCSAGQYTNEIILSRAPIKPLVIDEDRYLKTTYVIVKATDAEKQTFMLTEMSANDEMTNRLTCINYEPRYYEKDHTYL